MARPTLLYRTHRLGTFNATAKLKSAAVRTCALESCINLYTGKSAALVEPNRAPGSRKRCCGPFARHGARIGSIVSWRCAVFCRNREETRPVAIARGAIAG